MHSAVIRRAGGRSAIATLATGFVLWLAGALWTGLAWAAPSTYCPTLAATVANGGSIAIDVSACDGPFDGGMSGPIAPFAQNGTVTIGINSGGVQSVTYVHNGNAATADTFALEDNDLGVVTVTVTIGPAATPLVVSPAALPAITAGAAFSQALSSSGGTSPYTYTLAAGALPAGLSLSSSGTISGTPTQRGVYGFTVRSTDNVGQFAEKAYAGTVLNPSLSIAPGSATAIQGVAFSQALVASGGVAPRAFALESGAFPAGISISGSGVISGTTSVAPGTFGVTLRVTDGSTGPGSYFELETFSLVVSPPPAVSIAVSPASVTEDGATSLVFTVTRSVSITTDTVVNIATAGTATAGVDYTGAVTTVSIPANATTATITIVPTPDATVEPDETVTLTVTAGTGYTVGTPAGATGTILNDDVTIALSPSSLPAGTAGVAYSQSLSGNGGTGPYTFQVTAGALPAGLGLAADGTLSGTPSAGGTFNFTVTASDSRAVPGPNTGTQAYALAIGPAVISLPAVTLPAGFTGVAYNASVAPATGGTAPYTYFLSGGALPPGLQLDAAGALTGNPGAAGTFNFAVSATDSSTGTGPYTGSRNHSITVGNVVVTLADLVLGGGTLSPAFAPGTTAYAASVGNATASVTVTPTLADPAATVSVNGVAVASGSPSGAIALAIGANTISVVVTGRDGTTTRTYTVIVTRAKAAQAIVFGPAPVLASGGTATVSATGGASGNPVVFTSTTPGTCTVSGTTVSGLAAGTCTIAADQAGNAEYEDAPQVTQSFAVSPDPVRLTNNSTRGRVFAGNDVMIGGFIIGGTQPKTVVVRARGLSLVAQGVPGALADPLLQLFSGPTQIAANDNWQEAANAAALQASGFAPADAAESAILTTLAPGAYTAIVTGARGTRGVAIVEVFEIDAPGSPLLNIATRGPVLTGGEVMIGGFIVRGDGPQTVVIRARGPSLAALGVPGVLANPQLQLFAGSTQVAANDNWQDGPDAAAIQAAGFAPANALEAAIRVTLSPGAYTVIVSGVGGTTGVGIVEVFAQ